MPITWALEPSICYLCVDSPSDLNTENEPQRSGSICHILPFNAYDSHIFHFHKYSHPHKHTKNSKCSCLIEDDNGQEWYAKSNYERKCIAAHAIIYVNGHGAKHEVLLNTADQQRILIFTYVVLSPCAHLFKKELAQQTSYKNQTEWFCTWGHGLQNCYCVETWDMRHLFIF